MEKFKLLMLEDNTLDAELIKSELINNKFNFNVKLVETQKDFTNAIKNFKPDIILSDYALSQFTGFEALEIAKKHLSNIPFIIVTGALSEEMAADSIKKGAWDYVLKENLLRLSSAIKNAFKLKEEKDNNLKIKKDLLKLFTAVEQSANTVCITDTEGNIEYTNPKFTDLTGYTAIEVIGKNSSFLNSGYQSKEFYTKMWQRIKSGKAWKGEFRNKSKSGKLFWEQTTITPIKDTDGNIINFLAIKEDITEQKLIKEALMVSEKKYQDLYNNAPDMFVSVCPKTSNVLQCNQTLLNNLGYTFKEVLGKPVFKLYHPDCMDNVKKAFQVFVDTGEVRNAELQLKRKDTSKIDVILNISAVRDEQGKIISSRSSWRDITERKKMETELDKYRKLLEDENISLKEEISLSFNYEDMVYRSEEISDVLTQVEQVSTTNATVLILGETGTGKELIAKAIHNTSSRKNKPLIRVNCAAIPTELIESELFGHVKGSFTGAIKNRIGKFQLADGGTLFLDEIGEMPLALQPKLLRAIQEGEIEPIGSSKIHKLDIRIIAATNKDLEKEAEGKRFRQDLFFRLNVFPITIPPLRDRVDDIPVLIDYFLEKFCKKYNKKIEAISKTILQQMKVYKWPGNVRELENLVERAVIVSYENVLVFSGFSSSILNKSTKSDNINKNSLEEIQSNHIIKTLNLTKWKISGKDGAATLLDMKPSTLRDRMKKFGIERPKP